MEYQIINYKNWLDFKYDYQEIEFKSIGKRKLAQLPKPKDFQIPRYSKLKNHPSWIEAKNEILNSEVLATLSFEQLDERISDMKLLESIGAEFGDWIVLINRKDYFEFKRNSYIKWEDLYEYLYSIFENSLFELFQEARDNREEPPSKEEALKLLSDYFLKTRSS